MMKMFHKKIRKKKTGNFENFPDRKKEIEHFSLKMKHFSMKKFRFFDLGKFSKIPSFFFRFF